MNYTLIQPPHMLQNTSSTQNPLPILQYSFPQSQNTSPSNHQTRSPPTQLSTLNKKQYITKIRILEREVQQLKSQLQYKTEAHAREIQNIKIFMQYQMQQKIQKHKSKLREQYHNLFIELEKSQNESKHNNQQMCLLEQKNKRLEKYCHQLQQQRETKAILHQQQVQKIKQSFEKQLKLKDNDIEVLKADLKVENKRKQDNVKLDLKFFEKKNQVLIQQNEELTNKIADLKEKNTELRIEIQNLKSSKDRQIGELQTRLNIHRETSIEDYLTQTRFKRKENIKAMEYEVNKQCEIEIPRFSYTQNLRKQIERQNDIMKTALNREKIHSQKYSSTQKKANHTRVFGNIMKIGNKKASEYEAAAKKIYTQEKVHLHTIDTNFEDSEFYQSQVQSPTFATIN